MNDESRYHLLHDLRFLLTPEHECGYLPEQEALTLFVDPQCELNTARYSMLAEMGFRRSGDHLYRPHCENCKACIPLRVPAAGFTPSRSQKRVLIRNNDISVSWREARFLSEHFALYRKYMQSRHTGSSMDDDNPAYYERLLDTDWCETKLMECRLGTRLFAIAITDILRNGLSAVYTFFDPEFADRSPGSFAILKQIQYAVEQRKSHVYLGYWIRECDKMAYKNKFRPYEYFDGHHWRCSE